MEVSYGKKKVNSKIKENINTLVILFVQKVRLVFKLIIKVLLSDKYYKNNNKLDNFKI